MKIPLADQVRNLVTTPGSDFDDNVWHQLVELGPRALPHLLAEFDNAVTDGIRVAILRAVDQYRSPQALPLFSRGVSSLSAPVWKTAIDGLVSLGEPSIEVIQAAALEATAEKRAWLTEALEQIRGWRSNQSG